MSELDIERVVFSGYQFSEGDFVEVDSEFKGRIENRFKEDGESVYEVKTYDDEVKTKSEYALEFMADIDEEKVFGMWEEMTNMDDEQMETWDEHPCSNVGVDGGENIRDETLMLMGQAPEGWNDESYWLANKHLKHISEAMDGEQPDDAMSGGKGSCPTRWAVNLLNRGVNPFDEMPGGNPEFEENENDPKQFGEEAVSFRVSSTIPETRHDRTDFNEFGIRENRDENGDLISVDAVYEAMEPGPPEDRNGVRITEEFLQNVSDKDYSSRPPYLIDHDKSTLSHVGFVRDVWYSSQKEKLMVMTRAYNTGSEIHDEIISRLTFEPPTIPDGSLGLGPDYDFERNEADEVVLTDGKIQEFSTTPFPGGYDDGGLDVDYNGKPSEVGILLDSS